MRMIMLTAIGIGGATVIGALLGFAFGNISHRTSDLITAFAASVSKPIAPPARKTLTPFSYAYEIALKSSSPILSR